MSNKERYTYIRSIIFPFLFGCLFGLFGSVDGAMTIEQMQKTATGIRNTCITKTGVKAELVDGMKTGQYPEDHDLQCYTQCVMKTIRTFKNQKVDVDMVIKQVEMMMPIEWQDQMKAAARKCGALEPSDDICVTAFNYVKCYHKSIVIIKTLNVEVSKINIEKSDSYSLEKMRATILLISLFVVLANLYNVESKKMDMDQIRNVVKSARKTCASQIGASKELLDNAAQKGEFPPDPKLQCYLKCIMVLSKAMKNDQLRPEVMKTQAELMLIDEISERIKETIDKCYPSITSSDACEASWQFAKCYYETDSSIYFIP
ncbi:uncharacterized protein LOC118449626 [Vespa mandarinia]|uniref:uncharacterized protein LOC118449626 n=1 Tax=Vespa mandarinia TaxID=7446 RepID=UPI001607308E|nr:uncharacterized protein LOC118449626 [Vespa mandarinia]